MRGLLFEPGGSSRTPSRSSSRAKTAARVPSVAEVSTGVRPSFGVRGRGGAGTAGAVPAPRPANGTQAAIDAAHAL